VIRNSGTELEEVWNVARRQRLMRGPSPLTPGERERGVASPQSIQTIFS
jgi:hypothetical protein